MLLVKPLQLPILLRISALLYPTTLSLLGCGSKKTLNHTGSEKKLLPGHKNRLYIVVLACHQETGGGQSLKAETTGELYLASCQMLGSMVSCL